MHARLKIPSVIHSGLPYLDELNTACIDEGEQASDLNLSQSSASATTTEDREAGSMFFQRCN